VLLKDEEGCTTVRLKKMIPNLMVEDVNSTIVFYRDVLGFELLTTVPEAGQFNWAMMRRDGVEIMFQTRTSLAEEVPVLGDRAMGGALTFYTEVEDVQSLYTDLLGKVAIVQDMHKTFYGTREFAIQDCNGFVLAFAEAV
jgi:uncharacterized glyoxalase superfamily protein PhnB